MFIRNALLAVGLAFAVFETTDVPHTGWPALVAALLFYGLTAWVWRRGSRIAACGLAALMLLEVTQAHTWKGVGAATKDFAVVAGSVGLVVVAAFLARPALRRLGVPVALVVLVAAAFASAAGASSVQTLQFLSVQQSFSFDPQGPPTVGSRLFFGDALYNRVRQFGLPAGARVGHAEGVCTIVTGQQAQCMITAHVPNGQIVVAGGMLLHEGPMTTHYAIVGGAGAYGSARGTVLSRDVSQTKSLVTLRLTS